MKELFIRLFGQEKCYSVVNSTGECLLTVCAKTKKDACNKARKTLTARNWNGSFELKSI